MPLYLRKKDIYTAMQWQYSTNRKEWECRALSMLPTRIWQPVLGVFVFCFFILSNVCLLCSSSAQLISENWRVDKIDTNLFFALPELKMLDRSILLNAFDSLPCSYHLVIFTALYNHSRSKQNNKSQVGNICFFHIFMFLEVQNPMWMAQLLEDTE